MTVAGVDRTLSDAPQLSCMWLDKRSVGDYGETSAFFSQREQNVSHMYGAIFFYLAMTYPRRFMKNMPGWLFS